ncbi:MAG: accessory factor UbiK family protein [Gammaproteobacteria bacterium]|nr:accessory factor UbiK family protein [Gammaproteobacteria bacterium]
MIDLKFIDELSGRLSGGVAQVLPQGAKDLGQDVEKNIKAVLHASFEKLDLVTREEFDVQTEVLARTRAKIDELEKLVTELEQALKD